MANTFKAAYVQGVADYDAFASAGVTLDATTSDVTTAGTAGANGALLVGARFVPMQTTTAGAIWLFLSNDGGATFKPFDAQIIAAETLSVTAVGTAVDFKQQGAVISKDNAVRLGASTVIGFAFSTSITPSSGHVFHSQLENF
jgi:hypothetical protein